ncbi:MAG: DUF4445 domain-containing protein [Verrucomicrobia bacterium]|nr:DUF4445 domain-containing protein [Verrucomicrobiota bacterium]
MSKPPRRFVRIRLEPSGRVIQAPAGAPLQEVLFPYGVEFPCGGRGKCRGCRIRALEGELPVTEWDRQAFLPEELERGYRLACRAYAERDLTLEIAQWEGPILADETPVAFQPRPGLGAAVDIGSTTLVAQLLDLETGNVLGVETALNPQARFGADVMSRVEAAMDPAKAAELRELIRRATGRMIERLMAKASPEKAAKNQLERAVLVGNTAMHHFFCGLDAAPLARHPFAPADPRHRRFTPRELGWDFLPAGEILFLPCIAGFVGSDILAGALAARLHEIEGPALLMDLGTNGEIALRAGDRLLCASTAAGPAFEGGRIRFGMRAAAGAIAAASVNNGKLQIQTVSDAPARGLCGSGLVDVVAAALELGWIDPSGRIRTGDRIPLTENVWLTQRDIRELQLAKGAIAAGARVLCARRGVRPEQVRSAYLAGAFGNYVRPAAAARIGLFPFPEKRAVPLGNAALLGAKIVLLQNLPAEELEELRNRFEHVALNEDPAFQDAYIEEMRFAVPSAEQTA